MTTSLYAALSGIQANQKWIDLIGNNLANSSTPGFKSARATFADSISQTLRYASGPIGSAGGRNPIQVGLGVGLVGVDRSFEQGALTTTGRIFDLAIEGRGFFGVDTGNGRAYTRVGTFGLDANENLVDQRTGYRVIGPTGSPVVLDTHTLFPPRATDTVEFAGNLPAVITGPLAEVLTGSTALKEGTPATLTAADPGPNYSVTAGATYSLEIVASGGAPDLVTVTDSDSDGILTQAEIVAALDAADGVNAEVDGSGFISLQSDRTGEEATLRVIPGTTNDLADLINISTSQVYGTETTITDTTDLNALPSNLVDYVSGDEIDIIGVDTDGSPVNGTFVYGSDGTTAKELIDFIDGLYADATVSLNSSGQIVVTAETPGESELLLTINDDGAATGRTDWSDYAVSVTTEGTGPDRVTTSTEVFDSAGIAHTVTMTYERQADASWTMTATIEDGEGTVLDGEVTGIQFAEDGTPTGLGSVDGTIAIQFTGQTSTQEITLDFGSDGEFDGLTQFGSQATAFVQRQSGYAEGELASMSVKIDGTIEGFYTNGEVRTLGAVGIATFANPEGLQELGSNLWAATSNSGEPSLGSGAGQATGTVVGGALENSNVDTAEQFVHLIEAQRGFQASARIITTQDEVLQEVVNLI